MRARPKIAYEVPLSPDEVVQRFSAAFENPECPCAGSLGHNEIILHIEAEGRKPWSPYLQLAIGDDAGQTVVRGVMGPQPNLWTAFVFVYAVHLTIFTAGTVYGSVQMMIGDTPTGLVVGALALLGLACSCGLDLTGRRLGQGQMGVIRGLVIRTLPGARELGDAGLQADPAPEQGAP